MRRAIVEKLSEVASTDSDLEWLNLNELDGTPSTFRVFVGDRRAPGIGVRPALPAVAVARRMLLEAIEKAVHCIPSFWVT